jgi:predicted TIM-barrel enzyme
MRVQLQQLQNFKETLTMKILPVIHYLDHSTALDQVAVARECGAHGVFLISHHQDDNALVEVADLAKKAHPEFPIGINLLSSAPELAVARALDHGLDMMWADSMGVSSMGLTPLGVRMSELAKKHPAVGFFASVAFKYQPHEIGPATAARQALNAGFIPTTSGASTGSAPEVSKISAMSAASKGTLALASGITPENALLYTPYLSHILVATGISLDEHRMNPSRLRSLIASCSAAHG